MKNSESALGYCSITTISAIDRYLVLDGQLSLRTKKVVNFSGELMELKRAEKRFVSVWKSLISGLVFASKTRSNFFFVTYHVELIEECVQFVHVLFRVLAEVADVRRLVENFHVRLATEKQSSIIWSGQ